MANIEAANLPFVERPDLSPFLVHLTKNTKGANGRSAFDNLVSILTSGEIKGSDTRKGFVKGPNRAACLMDVPLGSLKYVLNASNSDPERPRYEPYGVVVTKEYGYKRGGRPVLYLSNSELEELSIPAQELWRVVRFESADGTGVNWVHEREWRAKGSFKLPKELKAVLVKNVADAKKLQKLVASEPKRFKAMPSSIIPLTIMCQGLPYL
ncbi:hypothetical protein [Corallococcus exiguus]|uniref:hypothetical protein n=1 Tax=Corallococcus exiguus TaxID=83462 RepID=UPI0014941B6A|nr:hypothetical protein [Corallococcus exiguus]NPD22042.1 hypothetical protein [Corallococcus exiguus]